MDGIFEVEVELDFVVDDDPDFELKDDFELLNADADADVDFVDSIELELDLEVPITGSPVDELEVAFVELIDVLVEVDEVVSVELVVLAVLSELVAP